MIKDPPRMTIRTAFPRPAPDTVAALQGAATGHLVDALGGRGALDWRIKPIVAESRTPSAFCGVAVTALAGAADNLGFYGALEVSRPGDVIVIATDEHDGCAVIGDLVLGMARNRGVVAVVTDGLVRDLAGIEQVGLPVFARGISPNSPARNGPAAVGEALTLGGVTIASGDVVVGDRDGVVVVPRDRVDAVIVALEEVRKLESENEAAVRDGLEIPGYVTELLASDQVRRLD